MPTPLTDADKVLRNDTGKSIATNIAAITSALTPSDIGDLGDVTLTNPITNGQVLTYDNASQKWVNGIGSVAVQCTQAEYDVWKANNQLKKSTLYVITDGMYLNGTALDLIYSNTTSGLSATNVQNAVDELASEKAEWSQLQDFPSVTPTSSDKILIVQSQGQGLVPYGSKLDSANPTVTGSLSMNRKASTTVGTNSATFGKNGTASGDYSFATGDGTTASGNRSFTTGANTTASGERSFATGTSSTASGAYSFAANYNTTASGESSHAIGENTTANHRSQFVFGEYNAIDDSSAVATARGNYIEIVGKGANASNRSNARTLDWSGNEVLAGGLKINGSDDVGIAPVGYNANTDRNTESVRQTAMRYLRTNCFSKGGSSSSVRYSGGYYFTYLFGGVTSYGYDTFVEFAQSLTSGEKVIYWGYNVSTDTFTKLFSIS